MPHVLCRLPRDQHQRGGGLADVAAFAGNRRALHLSEVHRLSDVLPRGRLDRRSRHRTLAGPATAGSLDGKPKMATTVTFATWIKEGFLASLEMTNKLFRRGAPPSCHLERSEGSYRLELFERLARLERSFSCSQFLKAS